MLGSWLIALYRDECYHLKEYSACDIENVEKIFNHQHSSLCNVIERTFGVLKKWFPIISGTMELLFFLVDKVTEIILACCILYNYLMGVDPDERLIAKVDQNILNSDIHNEGRNITNDRDADARRRAILPTSIATKMWNDYVCMINNWLYYIFGLYLLYNILIWSQSFTSYFNLVSNFSIASIWSLIF